MPSIARSITSWSGRDIRRSFRHARRISRSNDVDLSVIRKMGTYGKILIIIPKKVGTAVVRNKIRRRIRSLFYEKNCFNGEFSWIVYIKPPLASHSFGELSALFEQWEAQIGEYGQLARSKSSVRSLEPQAAADSPPVAQNTQPQ